MSSPFNLLSEYNHSQIRKYLNFFRQKRAASLRALDSEFEELRHDRFHEEMYSREDIEEALDVLRSAVSNHMNHDMGMLINMGSLTIAQLLEEAQDKGIDIELDTSSSENQVLLDSVEKMSLEALPKGARRAIDSLPSFKEETRNLKAEAGRLEDSNKSLQERYVSVQSLNASLSREISDLRSQLNSRAESKRDGDDDVDRLKEEIRVLKEENEKRFQNSDQYLRMKSMMLGKSDQIRELRQRLEKYEPQDMQGDGKDDP